jgi:hypothetical protein
MAPVAMKGAAMTAPVAVAKNPRRFMTISFALMDLVGVSTQVLADGAPPSVTLA